MVLKTFPTKFPVYFEQVLRRPDNIVSQEFSKHRTTSYDHSIISEYESLVSEWIATIDNALADGGDER